MAENDNVLRTFTRELPVTLNDHELQQYGRMLAEKVKEEELAVDLKAQKNKACNAQIQSIRNDIKRIADARAKGEELRGVVCIERLHGSLVEIVRTDRNEVVDVRPADMRDMQTGVPGANGEDAEEEGAAARERYFQPEPPDVGPGPEQGTGTVRSDTGENVGEVVESSYGDGVFVSKDDDDEEEGADDQEAHGRDPMEASAEEDPAPGAIDSKPSKMSRARVVKQAKAKNKKAKAKK